MSLKDMLTDENGEPIEDFADLSYADIIREKPKSKWQQVGDVLSKIGQVGLSVGAGSGDQGASYMLNQFNQLDENKAKREEARQNLLLKMKQNEEDKKYKAEQNKIARENNPYLLSREMMIEQNAHNQVINKIKSDPTLTKLSQAQNRLTNGLAITRRIQETGGVITPQQFQDLQQGVTLAATGGGQTVGAEREARYMDSLKQKMLNLQTKLTNNPTGIPSNDPLLVQIFKEADEVNKSIQSIAQKRADTLSKGQPGLYKKRPDLDEGRQEVLQTLFTQFKPEEASNGSNTIPNINRPKSVTQNGHTYILNEATGQYE